MNNIGKEIETKFDEFFKNEHEANVLSLCVTMTGKIVYGIFLSLLIDIYVDCNKNEFYTMDDKLTNDYHFTKHNIKFGRKLLRDLGILETSKLNNGRILHKINEDKLVQLAEESGWKKIDPREYSGSD